MDAEAADQGDWGPSLKAGASEQPRANASARPEPAPEVSWDAKLML